MDVWIGVLAFVLFLGFFTAVIVCIQAIKKQSDIIINSRLHHRLAGSEVIYANVGLVAVVVLVCLHMYIFIPALISFVLFVVLSAKAVSGLTEQGALVGTTFIEWEFMQSYKLVNQEDNDPNVIILKIRANRKQYVLICNREDRDKIKKIMSENGVRTTVTVS